MSSIVTRIFRPAEGPTISLAARHSDLRPGSGGRSSSISTSSICRFPGPDAIEEVAQTRIVEGQRARAADDLPDGVFPLGAEGFVEDFAGGNDPKVVIENHERLANGLDDAVGIGPRRFDFALRHLQLGNVGEGDDHALDPVVLRAIGQDAPQIP